MVSTLRSVRSESVWWSTGKQGSAPKDELFSVFLGEAGAGNVSGTQESTICSSLSSQGGYCNKNTNAQLPPSIRTHLSHSFKSLGGYETPCGFWITSRSLRSEGHSSDRTGRLLVFVVEQSQSNKTSLQLPSNSFEKRVWTVFFLKERL